MEPADLGLSVELANAIVERSSRPVQWIHMPVPRGRKDDAYFEPLKKLRLPATDQLYLGLVHLTDGVAGARARVETAKRYRSEFGVACECGFGRRDPETVCRFLTSIARLPRSKVMPNAVKTLDGGGEHAGIISQRHVDFAQKVRATLAEKILPGTS